GAGGTARRPRGPATAARGAVGLLPQRLAPAGVVHRQPAADRRRPARRLRRRGPFGGLAGGRAGGAAEGPSPLPRGGGRLYCLPTAHVALAVVLVGPCSAGPGRGVGVDTQHAGQDAGPSALKRPDDRLGTQPALPATLEREPGPAAVVRFEQVSKWYGNVIGINKMSLRILPGVTGLLGPNGAGKSTLLQLATGQLRPSQGEVTVLGQTAWNNPRLNRYLGLCPEQDAFYEWMTGRDFVRTCARLTGFGRAESEARAERALGLARMTEHADRAVGGYSKGMRQRTKLAQALVHDPEVLFLDEPFSGTDPVARRDLMDVVIGLGRQGKSVVVSSHVLHEVQALTQNIV